MRRKNQVRGQAWSSPIRVLPPLRSLKELLSSRNATGASPRMQRIFQPLYIAIQAACFLHPQSWLVLLEAQEPRSSPPGVDIRDLEQTTGSWDQEELPDARPLLPPLLLSKLKTEEDQKDVDTLSEQQTPLDQVPLHDSATSILDPLSAQS